LAYTTIVLLFVTTVELLKMCDSEFKYCLHSSLHHPIIRSWNANNCAVAAGTVVMCASRFKAI